MAWLLTIVAYFVLYFILYWVAVFVLNILGSLIMAPTAIAMEASEKRPTLQKWLFGVNLAATGILGSIFRIVYVGLVLIATLYFDLYFPYAPRTVAVIAGLFTWGALNSFSWGVILAIFLWGAEVVTL